MIHEHTTQTSLAGALALLTLLAVVAAGLGAAVVNRTWRWPLLIAALGGAVFQVGHFGEHLAQAGYWTTHRDDAPWMTPWAAALADSFGRLAPGTPAFGMEALHLVGNGIFLAGAVAILLTVSRSGPAASQRPARLGVAVQAVHVAEHIALTITVLAGGPARGLSTLFGTLDPGPGLWTFRILWHLSINAVATALLATALVRRRRATVPSRYPLFA